MEVLTLSQKKSSASTKLIDALKCISSVQVSVLLPTLFRGTQRGHSSKPLQHSIVNEKLRLFISRSRGFFPPLLPSLLKNLLVRRRSASSFERSANIFAKKLQQQVCIFTVLVSIFYQKSNLKTSQKPSSIAFPNCII